MTRTEGEQYHTLEESMSKTQKPRTLALMTAIAVAAVGLAACSSSSGSSADGKSSDFKACMLSGSGGINDRGFNQSAWEGLQAGMDKLGLPESDAKVLLPKTEADIVPQLQALVAQGCAVIVTVGFEAMDATSRAADANADQRFAIVDINMSPERDNVASLVFDDAASGFVGGYASAAISSTGTVGTFGGTSSPAVNAKMDGYVGGVKYFNEQHDADVDVVGWDPETQEGLYAGTYSDQAKGLQLAEQLASQGADVVFSVAGNVNLGAARAAQNLGISSLWSDTEGCEAASSFCDVFVGSVIKNVGGAVEQLVVDTYNDDYEPGLHLGTFENDGIGFIPGSGVSGSKITPEIQGELDAIAAGIADGSITVVSENSPQDG